MLLAIREKARGWIAWVVIVLIGAAFALFGLSSYMGPSGDGRVSASVNGTDIPRQQLDREFSNLRVEIERSRGSTLTQEEELLVRREALDRMINRTVILQYVEDRGMRITDQDLAGVLRSFEQFQRNGRFDRQLYEAFARRQGTTPGGLEQQLRRDVLLQTLVDGIGETALVTERDIDEIISLERQQRYLRYLLLDAEAFVDDVSVSDDEIQAYYDDNEDAFFTEERVRLEYVLLDRDAVRDQVELGEDEIRSRFEQVRDRYTTEETRVAGHILVAVRDDADDDAVEAARARIDEARERLEDGESFAEVAEDVSDDGSSARRGGSLGEIERGIYGDAFDDALFDLEEGAISDPVRTEFGFHLIQLEEIRGGGDVELDDVRAEIEADLIEERIGSVLFDEQTRLDNLAYDLPDSLEQVAEEMGLELRRTDWFTRSGAEDGIAAEDAVLAEVFTRRLLEERENSDALNLGDDRYVVVRVADYEEPEQRSLDDVREDIEQRLRTAKAADEARSVADSLLERLRDGESLSDLAEEYPMAELNEPGFVGRIGVQSPLLLQEVFRLPRPEEGSQSVGVAGIGRDRYALMEVSEVVDGDPEEIDADTRAQLRSQLRNQAAAQAIDAFVRDLRARADVEIREERLQ